MPSATEWLIQARLGLGQRAGGAAGSTGSGVRLQPAASFLAHAGIVSAFSIIPMVVCAPVLGTDSRATGQSRFRAGSVPR